MWFLKGFKTNLCLPAICASSVDISTLVFFISQSLITKVVAQVL